MKKNKVIYFYLLTALIIRFLFASFPGFHVDTDAWFAWALRLNELGLGSFYSDVIWTNYTPGYLYVLYLLGFLRNIFLWDPSIFYYVLKIPSILSEVLLGLLVYRFILKDFSKTTQVTLLLILFTPVFIFNSAVWGQIDGLLTLFLFLSILFLSKNDLFYSSIFFGLAFLIKPQTVAIAPIFILFLLKNFTFNNFLKLFVPAFLTIFVFSLPFFPNNPFFGPIQLFQKMLTDYPYNSLFAYNLWGTQGFWISDATPLFGTTYKNWGIILLALYWILITYFYFKKNLTLFSISSLAFLAFYFLPNHVHERYLYPALPFLLIVAWQYKSKILFLLTTLLSTIHLTNLYHVYVYYNEIYLKLSPVLYNEFLYNLVEQNSKTLSFISTVFFVIISIIVLKLSYVKSSQKS